MESYDKCIFHIDVNSAYLSWTAVYRLQKGDKIDLRKIPSVIGGDEKSRHGIVLAKSIPAKKYNIITGESLYSAFQKCPNLKVVHGDFELYNKCSKAMVEILLEYSPLLEQYSIDECFLEVTNKKYTREDYIKLAHQIKDKIKEKLGFTVNIGISSNKLLAKMASDFKKPDRVHTLFKEEVESKMWNLPIENLFMVGKATLPKLKKININTIGDLAKYDIEKLKYFFKSYGNMIHNYANGIDFSVIDANKKYKNKNMGNSTTIPFDVEDRETAHRVLLSLCETLGMRLRKSNNYCNVISISIRNSEFINYSKQKKIIDPINSTNELYKISCKLFDELWHGEPIRLLAVNTSIVSENFGVQLSLFDKKEDEKYIALEKTIDSIRDKYGNKSIMKSSFLHSGIKPISGRTEEELYR